MEFIKIISDETCIELIPFDSISSIKIVMGKLYINGEDKYLKVKDSAAFINTFIQLSKDAYIFTIKNHDGYAILCEKYN